MKREERLCWSEKIPEGSVVRRLLLRVNVKGVKEEGCEWNGKGMEISEGSKRSEDGRGKGGKTVGTKIWRKREMKESEMEKRK